MRVKNKEWRLTIENESQYYRMKDEEYKMRDKHVYLLFKESKLMGVFKYELLNRGVRSQISCYINKIILTFVRLYNNSIGEKKWIILTLTEKFLELIKNER